MKDGGRKGGDKEERADGGGRKDGRNRLKEGRKEGQDLKIGMKKKTEGKNERRRTEITSTFKKRGHTKRKPHSSSQWQLRAFFWFLFMFCLKSFLLHLYGQWHIRLAHDSFHV